MLIIRKSRLCASFFVILLLTEFYYIDLGGGVARIYHFLAAAILIWLSRFAPRLAKSPPFIALVIFWVVNLAAAFMADSPALALTSVASLSANVGIAAATALILVSGRFEAESLKRLIGGVAVISVIWAILQIALFKIFGFSLALSSEQESQISMGLAPAFRTEANTFAKFLVVPFLLYLPDFVRSRHKKNLSILFALLLTGLLLAFTRTAMYGLAVVLVFVFLWYFSRGYLIRSSKAWLKIGIMVAAGIVAYSAGVFGGSEYGLHKLANLFQQDEILEGYSGGFRLMAMDRMWEAFVASEKTIVIGNGWGQIYIQYGDEPFQIFAGDLLTALGYGGVLGGLAYLWLVGASCLSAKRAAGHSASPEMRNFAEGILFALLGVFTVGQMAGYTVAPEYWMILGVGAYLGTKEAESRLVTARVQDETIAAAGGLGRQ